MNNFSQFDQITTLSEELCNHIHVLNDELKSDLGSQVGTLLFRAVECASDTGSKANIVRDIFQSLFRAVDCASDTESKANIFRDIFQLLTANTWFLEKYESVRVMVRSQILELKHDLKKEANDIASEFARLTQYP